MRSVVERAARALDPVSWELMDWHEERDPGCSLCKARRDELLGEAGSIVERLREAGLVIVPREPTEGMVKARIPGKDYRQGARVTDYEMSVYRAMIGEALR